MEAMRGSQKSIILVARQLGVHIGPNDIPERFQIEDRELRTSETVSYTHLRATET